MTSERRKPYPFDQIEPKWQAIWDERQLFHAPNPGEKGFDPAKPKFYVLDMFPYPSGAGLHVGHPEGYTATDIVARYKRMRGFNVLHPMGWDAFGLPAEQYAIKSGQHPAVTTRENVAKFKAQLKRIGFSYDWQREINTTDPGYYKWTQWIFLQIYNSWFDPKANKAKPISTLIEKLDNDTTEPDVAWRTAPESRRRARLDNFRLAYVVNAPVWWCQELGTVLADEEVVEGRSEIGGFRVVRRPMRQWMLRITAYADRLVNELEALDWPESVKILQRNWIGRSEGAEVHFQIANSTEEITVFTTRPDTLYGATYMVLAPENQIVDALIPPNWPEGTPIEWKFACPNPRVAVETFRDFVSSLSDLQRQLGKSGAFSGVFAVNPVNQEQIPIFFSEYVVGHYGTGAIMGVPAHDQRDLDFARRFNLSVREVVARDSSWREVDEIQPGGGAVSVWVRFEDEKPTFDRWTPGTAFVQHGVAINSPVIEGLPSRDAIRKITAWLEERSQGKGAVNYKLRDWLFSRQRYWGEPFPIVWEDGKHRALDESELPVVSPPLNDYKPTGTGEPPLAKATAWVHYERGTSRLVRYWEQAAGMTALRETNVMPQWAGSCWYYLRFCDPHNDQRFVGEAAEQYWTGGANDEARMSNVEGMTKHENSSFVIRHSSFTKPGSVDLYVGGTEHAVLHLLYARFWHKVLFDLGYVSKAEPFQRLVNQGIILGEDGQKMSKSRGNIVNPDDVIDQHGADAFRCYEMFMGPLEQMKPWSTRGVEGVARFLARVWRLLMTDNQAGKWELSGKVKDVEPNKAQQKVLHATIKKVTQDIESFSFNTAISQMMIFVNAFTNVEIIPLSAIRTFLVLLDPFAPHIASELWERLNVKFTDAHGDITEHTWPHYDESVLTERESERAVQVNGRFVGVIKIPVLASKEEATDAAKALPKVPKTYLKVLVVGDKVVNFVTK